ncbi:hypothetical protein FACS1894123_11560 [Bacteroidia bacterium]|nr:hypothetical protein FACS1894123_11560 [Bacteroidia bacterium]
MAKNNREVEGIDEQALLNSIAGDSFMMQRSVPSMQTVPVDNIVISKPDTESIDDELIESTNNFKKVNGKQRKLALGEFRKQFMQTPKIENRKPVFISETIRDDLDKIVRLFGERSMSVSGLVENLARNFLETYKEDIEQWRKM